MLIETLADLLLNLIIGAVHIGVLLCSGGFIRA